MTDEPLSSLALILADLAQTVADHPVLFTLITAGLASTAVLALSNALFSRVRALRVVSDARSWDDAWPIGSLANIAEEMRADVTCTEKIITVFCGLGLASIIALAGIIAICASGYALYIFQNASFRMRVLLRASA